MKSIRIGKARKIKLVVNMVVSAMNFREVDDMLEFCETSGVLFHAQPVIFGRKAYSHNARDIQLTGEEIRSLHRRLASYMDQGKHLLFSQSTYLKVLQWPDFDQLNLQGTHPSRCFAGRFYVHIEPEGNIFPCNNQVGTFRAKNFVHDGFIPALIHAQSHKCKDCWHPYFNERKALFRFRYQPVRSVLKR